MFIKVAILGAGISGLSLAWYLKKKFQNSIEITILEKSSRVGGLIQTVSKDDFLFEKGPHSIRLSEAGINLLELIEELNLEDEMITAHESSKRRYLFSQRKLRPLPLSLWEIPFNSLTRKHLISFLKEPFIKAVYKNDESIYSFFSRRFGKDFTEQFIDPMISGIYAGDMRKLSMKACFPKILEKEITYGSLIKGLLVKANKEAKCISPFVRSNLQKGMLSFKKGLQTLTDTIKNRLEASILFETKIQKLKIGASSIRIEFANQNCIEPDFLFSTLPTEELSHLINELCYEGKEKLKQFPYSSVGVVNLGYKDNVLQQKGFGYLVPFTENEKILGCIWDSSIFPEQGKDQTRLTFMLKQENLVCDNKMLEIALECTKKHLNINAYPSQTDIYFVKQAIPQFEIGYLGWKHEIESQINSINSRFYLLGTAFKGVSVNDCINASRAISEDFIY